MIPAILASVAGGVISGVIKNAIASSGTAEESPQVLGKEDFLRLLTTQLRYQDPLNPLSNEAFIAQTAQFSSLEQLQNMNKALEQLTAQLSGNGAAGAAPLLGREVTVNGSPLTLQETGPVKLGYALPAPAASVFLLVQDEAGTLVRTLAPGQQGSGVHEVTFDGLDDAGRRLPPGSYSYRVLAMDANGRAIPGPVTGGGQVTGINVEGGQILLVIGDRRVPLSSVVGITAGPTP